MPQNTARGTPARVIILFALLTGGVAVLSWREAQRKEKGAIRYPTAIGDMSYFTPGGDPVAVSIHGSNFSLSEETGELLKRRDDRMWRVPLAVPRPRLYTTTETFPEGEVPPLYLKTGPGEFVKVELREAATAKSGD